MNKSTFNISLGIVVAVFIAAWFYSGTIKSGYASQADADPQAILERLRPAGEAILTGSPKPVPAPVTQQAPAPADPAPAVVAQTEPASAPAAAPAASLGKDTYASACFACHTTGVAGSPKIGDVAAWAPRIAQGMDTLNKHAIEGFQGSAGMMPPKGGRLDLSDEAIIAAVAYMVNESK